MNVQSLYRSVFWRIYLLGRIEHKMWESGGGDGGAIYDLVSISNYYYYFKQKGLLPAPHPPTFDLYTTGGVAKQRLDLLASIELNE